MQNECFPEATDEWPKGPVNSIAHVNPRYPVKRGREYSFVEMASVGEDFAGILRFDLRQLEGSGLARFRVGDTLFAKITPCPENGKVAFVNTMPSDLGLGSTEFIVLSPKSETVPRFLFHLACSHNVRGRAAARMEGSTGRQRVPEEVFTKRLLVPIPPPCEQAAIALILDAVDKGIGHTHLAVERAREMRRALVQRLFSEGIRGEQQKKTAVGLIPRSWNVMPVSAVVENFQYGLSMPMKSNGQLPILRMGNIQDGGVRLADLKYITLPEQLVAPYLVRRGDVLFNRTNSQDLVGKIGIYRHEREAAFASYLIRLFPDVTKVNAFFLGHVLNSYDAQCRIKRYATPGVQQVNINATNLGKVLIPIPAGPDGLEEQNRIASILEVADAVVQSYQPVIEGQKALKNSLMYDLFTGRVRLLKSSEGTSV